MHVQTLRWRTMLPLISVGLVLLFLAVLTGSAEANWSNPSVLIPNSAGGLTADAAVEPSTGLIHVAWIDNTAYHYHYSICDPAKTTNVCTAAADLGGGYTGSQPLDQAASAEMVRPSLAFAPSGDLYIGMAQPAYGSSKISGYRKKAVGSNTFAKFAPLSAGWAARLAVDTSNNVHIVWGAGGKLQYKEINSSGAQVATSSIPTPFGLDPWLAADTQGNVHIVFEESQVPPREIKYLRASSSGVLSPLQNISNNGANSTNSMVTLDSSNNLYFVWQDVGLISFRKCPNPFTNAVTDCVKTSVSSSDVGTDPTITTVSTYPFIAYYRRLTTGKNVIVWDGFKNTRQTVDNGQNEWFPVIRSTSNGKLHLVYRDGVSGIRYMNQPSGVGSQTKPAAPSNLNGTVDGAGVHLSWTDNSNDETGFHVERADGTCASPGTFGIIASPTSASYLDASVLGNHTYCYQVTAYNSAGDSNPSNTFEATTPAPPSPPAAPTNLVATASLQGQPLSVSLTWTPGDNTQTYFGIERGTGACNTSPTFGQINTSTVANYQDNSVGPNTTYCYRVYAHNAGGNSPFSNTDGATTPNEVHGTLANLTQGTLAKEVLPSVLKNQNGDIIVAWEQDVSTSSKKIQSRVAPGGGAFNPVSTIWNVFVGIGPSLFNSTGTDGNVLFHARATSGASFDAFRSTLSGTTWNPAANVTNTVGKTSQDPVGVEATDGKVWMAWRESTASLVNNVYVKQLGTANQYQISTSGSAAPRPAIAAGTSGDAYVAWTDMGPSGTGCCIKVDKWTGSAWQALPDVTHALPLSSPSIAFGSGKLYAVWTTGAKVWRSEYNGTSWSTPATLYVGTSPKNAKVSASNAAVYTVWADNGKAYLSKNNAAGVVISTGVTGAKQPAVYVDAAGLPYVAFSNNDIWYVANP